MAHDVVGLLQGVKQAEEAKTRAIAEAKNNAAKRIDGAEAKAAGVDAAVKKQLAEEEPLLKKSFEEKAASEIASLEANYIRKLDSLRASANTRQDTAAEALCRRFIDKWLGKTGK